MRYGAGMDLDIVFEDPRWDETGFSTLTEHAIGTTLTHLGIPTESVELSVLACNDARIRDLNATFRAKESATNVLSWPAQDVIPPALPAADFDGSVALGDIALAFETCAKEATDQGKTLDTHITHLIVHGTLHLLGYDHERDIDATLMERLEVEILGKLGLNNPYVEL